MKKLKYKYGDKIEIDEPFFGRIKVFLADYDENYAGKINYKVLKILSEEPILELGDYHHYSEKELKEMEVK